MSSASSSAFAGLIAVDRRRPGAFALAVRALFIAATSARFLLPAGISRRRFYVRLVSLLECLGPAFIKAGQILGTRRDLISKELADALARLSDNVAPLDPAAASAALREIYGDEVDALFTSIDEAPIASGSVASVYRARTRDGRYVAIKLQRPRVRKVIETDLELLRIGGALLSRLRVFRGVPITRVLERLCGAVEAQLDFVREATSLQRLRENLAAVPRVWVPHVMAAYCRDRAIVMELIPGLDATVPQRLSAAARRRLAAATLVAVYHMLFVDGFVHADLHRGNLYFTDAGEVIVLDAGFSIELSERLRRLFAEFFLNMSLGRGVRCAEIVIESAEGESAGADREGFTRAMADLVHRNHGLRAREFSLVDFATSMFNLQRRFGLHAATELVFPLLSLLVIEGAVRDLDPDADFQELARPILTRGLFGEKASGQ